jgi:hypothetical protein
MKSWMSNSASRFEIADEIDGCDMLRRSEASVMLPVSAAATKYSICFNVNRISSSGFAAPKFPTPRVEAIVVLAGQRFRTNPEMARSLPRRNNIIRNGTGSRSDQFDEVLGNRPAIARQSGTGTPAESSPIGRNRDVTLPRGKRRPASGVVQQRSRPPGNAESCDRPAWDKVSGLIGAPRGPADDDPPAEPAARAQGFRRVSAPCRIEGDAEA